tara:strand:+ start:27 stop:509 length:483 start_codon:yes stop_codon:yes gene_type:complete
MLTIKDIYKKYHSDVDASVTQKLFKEICEKFNIAMMDGLLSGKIFTMRSNMSNLSIRRLERNPARPTIDWWESNKYKQELLDAGTALYDNDTGEGEKWFIYYTDPWYCKFHWEKHRCKIPNKTAYRFTPTRGIKGNKEKLTKLLKEDDLAYLRFKTHGNV